MTLAHQIPEFIVYKIMIQTYSLNPHPTAKLIKKMWDGLKDTASKVNWNDGVALVVGGSWVENYLECYIEDELIDYDNWDKEIERIHNDIVDGNISTFPLWRCGADAYMEEGGCKSIILFSGKMTPFAY